MERTLLKIGMFLVLNSVLVATALFIVHKLEPTYKKYNWTTEATFSAIPGNQNFDFVLMGTSHAREFSRSGNHKMIETASGKTFFNLSKGSGHGGLLPNLSAWKYFTKRGNWTKHVIYFVDPWVFFSTKWNEENYFLEDEPLKADLFWLAIKSGYSAEVLINYVKSKLKPSYFSTKPLYDQTNKKFLKTVDTVLILKQNEKNYLDGLDEAIYQKYKLQFSLFISSLQDQNIKVTLIMPPTLLGEEPGSKMVREFLLQLKGVEFYDHTSLIKDTKLFYDLHHMNSEGIIMYFTQNMDLFR